MRSTASEIASKLPLPALAGLHNPDWVAKVLGFHHTYNVPIQPFGSTDNSFNHMTDERVVLRLGLVVEEVKELFKDGFGIDLVVNYMVKDGTDPAAYPHQFGEGELHKAFKRGEMDGTTERNGVEVADASGDIVYVLIGMLIEMGFDLRPVIDEIHAANLTKIGEDGKPIMREDGKVLKGPNYHAPNIATTLGLEV